MSDLRRRLIASTFSVAVIICLLLFAFHPWLQYVVAVFVAGMACIAIWEYEKFAKAKGGQMVLPVLLFFTFWAVLSFFIVSNTSWPGSVSLFVFFLAFLALFAIHFKEKNGAIVDLAVASFGLLYIALPMGMMLGILYFRGAQDGRWWMAYLLTVTKITDIGAYVAGSLLGKRKLAPHISPNKTIEGAFFGLLCAIGASFAFHLLGGAAPVGTFQLGTLAWLPLGCILGITGQFGDLSESLLKRDANKKDSNTLPGLGGVLDAVDSLLFNAPIIYLYLNFITV